MPRLALRIHMVYQLQVWQYLSASVDFDPITTGAFSLSSNDDVLISPSLSSLSLSPNIPFP